VIRRLLKLTLGVTGICVLMTGLVLGSGVLRPGRNATPIESPPFSGARFVRFPVTPQPLTGFATRQIRHPFMAFEGGGLHGNAYNSDVHVTGGPRGTDLTVVTRSVSPFPGGVCPTITFAKSGLIVAMCASLAAFELNLFAPHTLELLATHRLVTRPSTFEAAMKRDLDVIFLDTSGGSYFYLDHEDRAVLADAAQRIRRIAHRQTPSGAWEFSVTDSWDMTPYAPHDCLDVDNWFPKGECDPITSVMPDYHGRIWWVTRFGRVGTVDPATGAVAAMRFDGEEIENSLSADPDGMYVITDFALYHMVADETGRPRAVWSERYPRSDRYRYGNINKGSGSTPTLMDDARGRKYVAITDRGEDRTGLVVYRREATVSGPRQLCRVPLFTAEASAVEISPIGWGRSLVVKNDAGYRSAFHGTSEATIAGGIVRVDIREDDTGCDVVWTAPDRVPAVVGKLSTNGLLYYYTFEEQPDGENAWSFLALDFATGKPVFKQFVGLGQRFDINWGSPAVAADGTVYLGVFEGILAIADGPAARRGG
jgi:outer membrane protein assembly factor BamB